MKNSNTLYTGKLFGQNFSPRQIATIGLAITVMLQGLLPCAVAAENVTKSQEMAYALANPSFGEVLMKADPTRGMEEEKAMTEEEFEALQKETLARQELEAKTKTDKAAVVQSFANTVNALPILATATVGVALNKGADIQEGLSSLDRQQVAQEGSEKLSTVKFVEALKKPVLQIVADAEVRPDGRLALVAPNEGPPPDNSQLLSQNMSAGGDAVDQLTNKTISKLIELERLNTYFRIETTRQSKWRKWRSFLVNEQLDIGVAAMTSIYCINTLRALQRGVVFGTTIHVSSTKVFPFGHIKNFYTHGNFFKIGPNSAYELAFYGTIPFISVALAQQTYEILQNFYYDWQTKKRGFDPEATKAKAIVLRDEIDALIAQRGQAVASHVGSPQDQDMLSTEGKVLHDIRDLELDEYGRYYSAARRARPVQNAFYIPEALRRGVALSAAIVGTVAQQRQELNIFGAFGILEFTTGILSAAAPIAAVITNDVQKKRAAKALIPVLTGQNIHTVEALDADRKHFEDLALTTPSEPQFGTRASIYKMSSDNAAASLALSHREEVAARQLFKTAFYLKSIATGLLCSYGILGIVSYAHYTNLRHIAQLGFATALQLEILTVYGAIDLGIRFPLQERKLARERAQGLLPGQVLTSRINNLDRMETMVSGKVINAPK